MTELSIDPDYIRLVYPCTSDKASETQFKQIESQLSQMEPSARSSSLRELLLNAPISGSACGFTHKPDAELAKSMEDQTMATEFLTCRAFTVNQLIQALSK